MSVDLTETERVARQVAAEWHLNLGEPFAMAHVSYVAPVGADTVLKVAWAGDDESLDEHAALELWAGDGAVRLHRADPARRALLEERAVPGDDISNLSEDEATAVAVDIATRLWRRAGAPFRRVADEVPRWLDDNVSALTPYARELWEEFEPGHDWLVHGDFHHHNILRHGSRYVAIDPKPYLSDREYDLFSWLRNPLDYRMTDREQTERRIAAFVAAGLDDRRIRIWTIVRGAFLTDDPDELELLRTLLD
ncbi:MAG TPA: aminoglycoside phosphotransferase family protein [Gaiellaceae bacterium]|nr:aminoglycoside phosphotransferase family protein [Gaiellaceae bacterium]